MTRFSMPMQVLPVFLSRFSLSFFFSNSLIDLIYCLTMCVAAYHILPAINRRHIMREFLAGLIVAMVATAQGFALPVGPEPVSGYVSKADGKPAAGAIVWAAKFEYGPLVSQQTTADENGRYALKLSPGSWFIWARHGTQGANVPASHQAVEIVANRPPDELNITLEERGKLRGRLLEAETGKPIAGGKLFLDAGLALTTSQNGEFEMGGLRRDHHEAFVVAPGCMRIRVLFDTTERADTELEVPVPRGGKISGRVTDLDGKPIPGAYVGRHTSGSYFSINGLFQACDADGRFEYDDAVPPDQPTRLAGFAPGYVEDERNGTSGGFDGKPLRLNFRLKPKPPPEPKGDNDTRRIVSGVVLAPNGVPQPGITVRWGFEAYVGAIEVKTNDAGRFKITAPGEAGVLAVLSRQYLPEFSTVEAGGDKEEIVVKLRTGPSVQGRVVDEDSKPIQDVGVYALMQAPNARVANTYPLTEKGVKTDAEGKFSMQGVPDIADFAFLKAGLTDVRNQRLKFNGQENEIVMQYGGAIKGQAVDANGKPIRNFRVLVGFPNARQVGDKSDGFFAGYSGMGVRFTSADGTFVLTGVGAGSVYRVTVLADGHGEAVEDRLNAVPVNRLEKTAATILKAGPPLRLLVRAVTPDGKPVAAARVTLVNGDARLDQTFTWGYDDASWNNMVRGRTSTDGSVDFKALGFSGATVLVQAPGFARQKIGWRNAQRELSVTLERECILTGEVRNAAGQPLPEFYMNLSSPSDRIGASVSADDKGRFRIAELPAGAWTLVVHGGAAGDDLHQEQIKFNEGETKDLAIQIKK
jgi:uncharacterized GH25 family protein